MAKFSTVFELVAKEKPALPVHILRPHVISTAAAWFLDNFPGKVVYSVKSNPDIEVLHLLHDAGVEHFDVTSIAEIKLIAEQFPGAPLHFMNPVKSRESIRSAYFEYGVRDFSLDCEAELCKILEETDYATDLRFFVRLAISNDSAAMSLSGKFGISVLEAPSLLRECQKYAKKTGICFHVGSQTMNPDSYANAIRLVANLLYSNGLSVDVLDIGGGFPSIYPGLVPPELVLYMNAVREAFEEIRAINPACELWSEPGRALVAEGGALLVRVELRKGNRLYINDGVYGTLFDAGMLDFPFPARMVNAHGYTAPETEGFMLFGPTCDSLDKIKGPFHLPSNIQEGDWIEIGGLGAYGASLQSKFNGFYSEERANLADAPMMSMFGLSAPLDSEQQKKTA